MKYLIFLLVGLLLGAGGMYQFGPIKDHGHSSSITINPDHGDNHGDHTQSIALELSGSVIPTISMNINPDVFGGYNLELSTTNFSFVPYGKILNSTGMISGHAHLYIDDVKITRLYSPDYYIPADWLSSGWHQIRVSLNDNNHTPFSQSGKLIQALETLIVP